MLIVKINKGENIEVALKKFKYKFKKTKVAEQLRDNLYYDKPSVKKRLVKNNAIYIQKTKNQSED